MSLFKKRCLLIAVVVAFLLICSAGLFYISKARNFQFFANLISSVPNPDKKIALTLDDGPTNSTQNILDTLRKYNIKATFFVCGSDIANRPEDAKSIVAAGHELGNHSYSHQRMVLKSYAFCKNEIEKTNTLIRSAGYKGEIFFRPPYGKKLFVLPFYLHQAGMTTVMWNMEPESILGFDATPEKIAEYVLDHIQSGSILLLHPMYNEKNVLPALELIIPQLQSQGYTFCTVAELYDAYK